MVRSGLLGAPGRLPDRWNGLEVAGQRKYRTVGGGVFGLPRADGTRQDWAFPVTEAYLGGSRAEAPISLASYEPPALDRRNVAQGSWVTPPEEELGQWPNYVSSVSRPFYAPEEVQERIPLKSSLASLISGATDAALVDDPALMGAETRQILAGGTIPERVGKGPVRQSSIGLSSPRRRGLGLDQDPSRADFYREYLSEAPRTPLYRDPRSMDYSGGQPVEQFPVDWSTGLPSDVPLMARGRFGRDFEENQLLSGDGLGFRSESPETASLLPKRTGVEAAINSLEPIIVFGADGVARKKMIDPQIAVDQDTPNPDSTAAFERTRDVILGERIRQIQEEAKTPIMPRSALIQAYKDGRFQPLPESERVGTLIGYLRNERAPDVDPIPVYAPERDGKPLTITRDIAKRGPYGSYVVPEVEQIYRVGHELNRDDDFIRESLNPRYLDQGTIPELQVRTRVAPQRDRPINLSALLTRAEEGYQIVAADSPLFGLTPEGLKARVNMLRQQPMQIDEATGRPTNSFAGKLDVYKDGELLQSIVPEVDQGGSYTGRFLPLKAEEEGPSFLLSAPLRRIKGEEFGSRKTEMSEVGAGFEGTLNRLGKGAFMQGPRTADGIRDVIAPMLLDGRLTAQQIEADPRLSHLFRPGSHARTILEQEVLSLSKGANRAFVGPSPAAASSSTPLERGDSVQAWRPWENPVPIAESKIYSPQSQFEINLEGTSPQREAAKRILRQTGQLSLPVQGLGGGYAPSYIDEVAQYMNRRTDPLGGGAMIRDRSGGVQGELFPIAEVNPSAYASGATEPSPVIPLPMNERGLRQGDLEGLGWLAALSARSRVVPNDYQPTGPRVTKFNPPRLF